MVNMLVLKPFLMEFYYHFLEKYIKSKKIFSILNLKFPLGYFTRCRILNESRGLSIK